MSKKVMSKIPNATGGGKKVSFYKPATEETVGGFNDSYPIAVKYYDIEGELKHLAGKILTFVNMAILEKQANKAWKDNIKQEFWKSIGRYQNICSEGKCGQQVNFDVSPDNELR